MQFKLALTASLLVSLAGLVSASSVSQVKSDITAIDQSVLVLYQHCQTTSLNYFGLQG